MPKIQLSKDVLLYHTDCLDRSAEIVEQWEEVKKIEVDRWVTIQGDEPLFNVETLDTDLSPSIVNFYTEIVFFRRLYFNYGVNPRYDGDSSTS